MDKKALQLVSRFSLPPSSLGYCGKDTAPAKLIKCAISGDCNGVGEELKNFIVLNPYLETLKKITGLPKLSYKNVEAYWLGNEALEEAAIKDYDLLLKNFQKQGVKQELIDELKGDIPKKFFPFHMFQVLHVGVGRASGSVPYNLETINNCMVRWGEVTRLNKGKLSVFIWRLTKTKGNRSLRQAKEQFEYREDFLPGLKVGDTIAVHWKQVVKILTNEEKKNLDYWTRKTLLALGS